MNDGCRWQTGNDTNVSFWQDKWLDLEKPLCDYATTILDEGELKHKVCEQIIENGEWRMNKLKSLLLKQVCKIVQGHHCLNLLMGEDRI